VTGCVRNNPPPFIRWIVQTRPAGRPRPTTPALIVARGLAARVPGRLLFDGLDFSIGPGLSCIIGGDERGKTTLLSILAGRRAPDAGSVRFGARPRSSARIRGHRSMTH
jgi:ABC-type multidrug transport system ATPase subunit